MAPAPMAVAAVEGDGRAEKCSYCVYSEIKDKISILKVMGIKKEILSVLL